MCQMFRKYTESLTIILSLACLFMSSCSPKIGRFENILERVNADPEFLTLHRDSIRFSLKGALPIPQLTKDTKVYLYPEYRYGEGALRLGEFIPFDGKFQQTSVSVPIDEKFRFAFLEGMEEGTLVLKALVIDKNKVYNVTEKTIGRGVDTTPMLTRVGQITPDEPIPEIGLYMTTDFSGINSQEQREYTVPFVQGKEELASKNLPAPLTNLILRGERDMAISEIKITGLASPETPDLSDPQLPAKRAEAMEKRLKINRSLQKVPFELDSRRNDWFDFRVLLSEYSGINPDQKEAYSEILSGDGNYEFKLRAMRQLNTFNKVSKDLFPKLRAAKVSVTLENTRFSNPEIAASVFKLLNEDKNLEGIAKEHLVYAGSKAVRLKEKETIYKKLVEIHPSELSSNNLGVVYLNQAQRELDVRRRNDLINQSIAMFRQANSIRTNSVSMHNLGRALMLREDYFEAYIAISEASTLEKTETNEFIRYNEGVRGALDILNGDYKLATIRFTRAPETSANLFNKGLAYYLAQDYRLALESFEESVQVDRENGYGFYGLALVAAQSADRQALFENLQKAVQRSEYLRERAISDIVFYPFRQEKEFIKCLRVE